jgi:hypothetical protein
MDLLDWLHLSRFHTQLCLPAYLARTACLASSQPTLFSPLFCSRPVGSSKVALDCLQQPNGLYWDLEYCNVYWECRSGRAKKYECPIDYAWHHSDKRCDLIANVDCSRAQPLTTPLVAIATTAKPAEVASTTTATSSTNTPLNRNQTTSITTTTVATVYTVAVTVAVTVTTAPNNPNNTNITATNTYSTNSTDAVTGKSTTTSTVAGTGTGTTNRTTSNTTTNMTTTMSFGSSKCSFYLWGD